MADKYFLNPRFSKQQRVEILIPWAVTEDELKANNLTRFNPNYRFALDGQVLSMCCGVVLSTAQDLDNTFVVIVQYNITQCVMYEHLASVSVESGQAIKEGHLLGKCSRYFQLCYLQKSQVYTDFPVKVCGEVYYKFDPSEILYDRKSLPYSGLADVVYGENLPYHEFVPTSQEQNDEFANGRGEPDV